MSISYTQYVISPTRSPPFFWGRFKFNFPNGVEVFTDRAEKKIDACEFYRSTRQATVGRQD